MITVSAPGKIHLMGEHAVVYGKPALLSAINLRLKVSVEPFSPVSSRPRVKARDKLRPGSMDDNNVTIKSSEPDDYIRSIVDLVQEHFKVKKLPAMNITVDSQIPAGYHLGSSAATAVATVGALIYFLKKTWNPALINQLAYEAEKKQHGNPSGGDNTAVTFGGFLWYRKELEFLKSIWQLPFRPAANLTHFFLIDTGKPKETTGEMVALVKGKRQKAKGNMEQLMNQNEEQTKRITVALKEGNEEELIHAMQVGERTLEGMGVVSNKVVPLIRSIEKAGGAAKILGGGGKAGGVGFLLVFHHEPEKIEKLSKPFGFSIRHIRLGEEGARLEHQRITN